ncbi:hypothetical protein MBM_08155 [Drepanopeziza brunnea f. sp. 'multigermtubi' MB_m1]|uniref:Uncharacterized protein n=1 Tax=Marssonina brunnea f. sp. multigermtubi (strain MB_m1) TaxID=1072389 RepID=K1XN80_MARBU|nr:uncharacterized protein MBM_08155 [Drepanopeziza brunnea f. sp. 'multigermtubi' MB_m1]EKD13954.1 hypothetical protein MBM_08155 [Drepanopeziza brunnea f. sp. 'multigermtubi' MB_m1]
MTGEATTGQGLRGYGGRTGTDRDRAAGCDWPVVSACSQAALRRPLIALRGVGSHGRLPAGLLVDIVEARLGRRRGARAGLFASLWPGKWSRQSCHDSESGFMREERKSGQRFHSLLPLFFDILDRHDLTSVAHRRQYLPYSSCTKSQRLILDIGPIHPVSRLSSLVSCVSSLIRSTTFHQIQEQENSRAKERQAKHGDPDPDPAATAHHPHQPPVRAPPPHAQLPRHPGPPRPDAHLARSARPLPRPAATYPAPAPGRPHPAALAGRPARAHRTDAAPHLPHAHDPRRAPPGPQPRRHPAEPPAAAPAERRGARLLGRAPVGFLSLWVGGWLVYRLCSVCYSRLREEYEYHLMTIQIEI